MNLAIFGASRGVGRAAVDAALAAGHHVTAFSRSAGTLEGTGARVCLGDVLDSRAVGDALEGCDAVLISLGVTPGQRDTTPTDVCSRGTEVILKEMAARSINRVAVVTSYGVGETREKTPFPFSIIAKTVLKSIMEDKERQEQAVRASGTRWTIVQPLGLTDDPATGRPFVSAAGARETNRVSRADVALAALQMLESGTCIGESVAVSAGK